MIKFNEIINFSSIFLYRSFSCWTKISNMFLWNHSFSQYVDIHDTLKRNFLLLKKLNYYKIRCPLLIVTIFLQPLIFESNFNCPITENFSSLWRQDYKRALSKVFVNYVIFINPFKIKNFSKWKRFEMKPKKKKYPINVSIGISKPRPYHPPRAIQR